MNANFQVLAKLRTQINLGKMSLTDPRVNELLADIFIVSFFPSEIP